MLADQKRSTPGKVSSVCMHSCHARPLCSIHAVSQESQSQALILVWKGLLPSSFLQRTRVILFKSSLAQSHLTQVPDLHVLPRERRKTRNFVAHIASWSWMMLIALKAINFRKHSLAHWVRKTTTKQGIKILITAHYFTNLRRAAVARLTCESQAHIVWILPGNLKPWFWNTVQGFSSGLAEDLHPKNCSLRPPRGFRRTMHW